MRFFAILDYQHEILAVFLGVVTALLIYLAFRSHYFTREREEEESHRDLEYPDEIHGKSHPVPPFLLFVIFGFIVWFFIYVIFFGVRGGRV